MFLPVITFTANVALNITIMYHNISVLGRTQLIVSLFFVVFPSCGVTGRENPTPPPLSSSCMIFSCEPIHTMHIIVIS